MVVEKTQVFHYCEPGGGEGKRERERERERSSAVMWIHIVAAGAKPAKAHTNGLWKGRQMARLWGLARRADGGQ